MKKAISILVLFFALISTVKAQTDFVPNNNVIYELNLYNFTQEGTLSAAQKQISNLKNIGVDIIWLMPIQTRGTKDKIGALGSPYALKNYTEVNPDHGTLADLQAFVKEAHNQGMQVWLDWVANHTAKDNVWTTEHKDYYSLSNGAFTSPNGYGDVYQLNFSNSDLQQAMIDAMQYWITNADIDGFRCDYASSSAIPTTFWTKAVSTLRSQANGKQITLLAEADFSDKSSMFDSKWDYDFAWGFQSALTQVTTATTLKAKCMALTTNNNYTSRTSRMVYLTNHDQNYSSSMKSQYAANQYSLTALLFTIYGMPMLYDGQETGYLYDHKLDYFNRSVIDWTSVDEKMLASVKALANLKHSTSALTDDPTKREVTYLTTSIPAATMAYVRKSGGEEVMVVVNVTSNPKTIMISDVEEGEWTKALDSSTITKSSDSSSMNLTATTQLTIEANGFMVFTKGVDTAIRQIENDELKAEGSNMVYDLMGRKVSNPHNGLYIVNGKKMLFK